VAAAAAATVAAAVAASAAEVAATAAAVVTAAVAADADIKRLQSTLCHGHALAAIASRAVRHGTQQLTLL